MRDCTSRHVEFELATTTALSVFPDVEAKCEEQRNCSKHLVGRIDVFEILPTGFGKSLIFQLFPRIKSKLEWRQDRMPFTIVVVTLLIAIMKDQVEHLNIIGVKRGSCEIVYWSPKSWLSSRRKGWKASCNHRYLSSTQSSNSKFSLQLLCIFIAWVNGFLSKWAIFVCRLIHNFFTYTLKSCFKAVKKFIVHEHFSSSLLSEILTLGF